MPLPAAPATGNPQPGFGKGGCDGGLPHSHLHQRLVIRKLVQHQPLNSHGCRTSCPRPRRGKGEGDPAGGELSSTLIGEYWGGTIRDAGANAGKPEIQGIVNRWER